MQRDEGPCLDSYRTGQAVKVADLSMHVAQWPRFVAAAAGQGFTSVHAIPMRLGRERLGALGLFGAAPGALNDDDLTLAQGLAHVASIAIVQNGRNSDRASVLPGLETAVASRAVLEIAKGVLAEVHGLEMQEAFTRLRAYAHRHHLRLTEVARLVVTGASDDRQQALAELGDDSIPTRSETG